MKYIILMVVEGDSAEQVHNRMCKAGGEKIQVTYAEEYEWRSRGGLKFKTFPLIQLTGDPISKKELAEKMGISNTTFDYALPQDWLDGFLEKHPNLPYRLVLSSSFWVYPEGSIFGFPISGCSEVQTAMEAEGAK